MDFGFKEVPWGEKQSLVGIDGCIEDKTHACFTA